MMINTSASFSRDRLDRFNQTIKAFDKANAEDPNKEVVEGESVAKELIYAQRMTACMEAFAPKAPEIVFLAARCQHIKRWEKPRSAYPDGKAGYYKWRTELYRYHGSVAGDIMAQQGYDAESISQLKRLFLKKDIKIDEASQCLEDVICLVFLEYYFDSFIEKHSEEKLIGIVQKTWKKMSDKGHKAALKLKLSSRGQDIISKALAS